MPDQVAVLRSRTLLLSAEKVAGTEVDEAVVLDHERALRSLAWIMSVPFSRTFNVPPRSTSSPHRGSLAIRLEGQYRIAWRHAVTVPTSKRPAPNPKFHGLKLTSSRSAQDEDDGDLARVEDGLVALPEVLGLGNLNVAHGV